MRLLTKSQVENKKQKEKEALFRQGQQMLKFVEEARLELNNIKIQREKELAEMDAVFTRTFEELNARRMKVEMEIKELEDKRDGLRASTTSG